MCNTPPVQTCAEITMFLLQVIYIGCAYATVYLIYVKFKATYDGNHDTFRVEFLVVPVGGLAFLVNHDFSPLEVGNLAIMSDVDAIHQRDTKHL